MKTINAAKTRLEHLETEREKLKLALQDVERQILDLKLEVAEYVLREDPKKTTETQTAKKEDDGMLAFVRIEFKPGGKSYDYLWKYQEKPGEYVYVESYDHGMQKVKVLKAWRGYKSPKVNYKEAHPRDPYDK